MSKMATEPIKEQAYSKPEITEIGVAAALTLGNTWGTSIDPGVPPISGVSVIYST